MFRPEPPVDGGTDDLHAAWRSSGRLIRRSTGFITGFRRTHQEDCQQVRVADPAVIRRRLARPLFALIPPRPVAANLDDVAGTFVTAGEQNTICVLHIWRLTLLGYRPVSDGSSFHGLT